MTRLPEDDPAGPPDREAAIRAWADALRAGASEAALRALPPLAPDEAAQLLALLSTPPAPPMPEAPGVASAVSPAGERAIAARFRPCLTLQTLTRGDGLLGVKPFGGLGPRGAAVTVATIVWTYCAPGGLQWETAAPRSVLGRRAPPLVEIDDGRGGTCLLRRDLPAESDALDAIRTLGFSPVPGEAMQWRSSQAAQGHDDLWALPQESAYGGFWAEEVPRLQAAGWSVRVRPGFVHETVAVQSWRCVIRAADGTVVAQEPADIVGAGPGSDAPVRALRLAPREGSWMLSLGIEVAGEVKDPVPLIVELLRRDRRWLDAELIAAMPDDAIVRLREPGGRRIETVAAPLKAIVGAMVDLLTDPRRRDGPFRFSAWDAGRLDVLGLLESQPRRAGPRGAWQLEGDAGLLALARRLREAGTPKPVDVPPGLGLALRPYQRDGLAWLQYLREHHLAGILADEMGLGKTAQALAHLLVEKRAGRLDRPALVVLPTSLLFNWVAEAARIAPELSVLVLHGPERGREAGRIGAHDLVLTTYALLWRDVALLEREPFHVVILDEAQMVKNAAGRSAAAARRLVARHRLCLTGTPLENHLGELWAQFDFLMPGFLGDAKGFQRRWRDPIEKNGETLRAQALAQRVRPFVLRRRKDDVARELPPKTEAIRRLPLEGHQRALYESVRVAADEEVRRLLKRDGVEGHLIAILDALLKLRQVCCDPFLVKGRKMPRAMERAKLAWLRETLPALVAEGRRVIVFSQFTEMLGLVEAELPALGLPWLALTGATPPARRGAVVRAFQRLEVPLLLASLKAGGVGLNLTAADTVIHVDPWWNPAVEAQATDRAHRIGQDKPVVVYKLIAAGSIEERMLDWQARKRALAEGVLGRDGEGAPKFSREELDALLAPLADGGEFFRAEGRRSPR